MTETSRASTAFRWLGRRATLATAARMLATAALALGCETDEDLARKAGARVLTAAEIRAEFPGNTVYGETGLVGGTRFYYFVHYRSDGTLAGKGGQSLEEARRASDELALDKGKWRIDDRAQALCTHWDHWMQAKEWCGPVYKQGDEHLAFSPKGAMALKYKIAKGNALKL